MNPARHLASRGMLVFAIMGLGPAGAQAAGGSEQLARI